jgi:hypothetical protein
MRQRIGNFANHSPQAQARLPFSSSDVRQPFVRSIAGPQPFSDGNGQHPKEKDPVSVHAINDFLTHFAGVLINAAVALAAR